MVARTLPRRELMRVIHRFLKDKNRGISTKLFSELCGISQSQMQDVFLYRTAPLSEYIQIRVSKGYTAWLNGEVKIMQNRDNTRFVEYRKEPQPRLVRTTGLQLVNGEIKIRVGIRNKADYSHTTLDEQLGKE
jgi:hypothetical protein